MKVYDVIVVI